ncbi:MAG: four helix bundle protein [Proteobacteria bacterium]|nr:four helix bundle protein [Pseudomonadota bacterium]
MSEQIADRQTRRDAEREAAGKVRLPYARNFEDLVVFRKAYRVSLEILKVTEGFPRHELWPGGLGEQMRKACRGICANIAEGFGKKASRAEFKRFIGMALGSAEEMRVWLRYCLDMKLISKKEWEAWRLAYAEVARMLQVMKTQK